MRLPSRWQITWTLRWLATICPSPIPTFCAPRPVAHFWVSMGASYPILRAEAREALARESRELAPAAQQRALGEQVLALAVLLVTPAAPALNPIVLIP